MYIINETVIFDPDNKALYLKSEDAIEIKIPLTACYLMIYLIKNAGSVVERSELLENVWDKRGYTSSNASLNNNISILRKSYTELTGLELGLETIPKVGFKLNAKVSLASPVNKMINRRSANKKPILLFFCLLLSFLYTGYITLLQNKGSLKPKEVTFIKKIKSCTIYSYDVKEENLIALNIKYVEDRCNGNKMDVFLHKDDSLKDFHLYTFCETSGNTYKSCNNEKTINIG
ncbi:DNA-binding winged helix-turn-helix (wHTH) domain-containing protein [Pantoea sesami]|nr:DNA-binding winged helix-turn-helix (wHTH) domain-containing protein [Pantoea sesami]